MHTGRCRPGIRSLDRSFRERERTRTGVTNGSDRRLRASNGMSSRNWEQITFGNPRRLRPVTVPPIPPSIQMAIASSETSLVVLFIPVIGILERPLLRMLPDAPPVGGIPGGTELARP